MKKYIPYCCALLVVGLSACRQEIHLDTPAQVRCTDPVHAVIAFKSADTAVVNGLGSVDIEQHDFGASGYGQPLKTFRDIPLRHDKAGMAYFPLTDATNTGIVGIYVWVFTVKPSGKIFHLSDIGYTNDTTLIPRPSTLCSNMAVYSVYSDQLSVKYPYNDTSCTLDIPYQ